MASPASETAFASVFATSSLLYVNSAYGAICTSFCLTTFSKLLADLRISAMTFRRSALLRQFLKSACLVVSYTIIFHPTLNTLDIDTQRKLSRVS
jgi:hypothetical protein